MPGLSLERPVGALRTGWSALVGDYAIAGDWTCNGDLLMVGDSAGGVYAFDGKSGATSWQHPEIHDGGLLALAIQPGGDLLATTGQDGRIRIWNPLDGQVIHMLELGRGWVEMWNGRRMANGWRLLSLAEFMYSTLKGKRCGDPRTTPVQ